MNAKTILIIILTALVTVILMKNMDEVNFWIFGNHSVPKLAVLGTMFVIGVVVGLMLGRGKKKKEEDPFWDEGEDNQGPFLEINNTLDDEDAEYIR